MIRGVTFDFWQTLAEDAPENLAAQRRLRLEALHSALRWSGLEVDADQVEEGYERSQGLLEERFWNRHRDPGFAEQVALVLDCVAPGAAARVTGSRMDALLRGYADPVLRWPPALCPGAGDAVRTLAAQGLRLGVISNTGRTPGMVLRRYLEREGLLRHFQVVTFSDEVGLRKPEAEIFRRTLAKLGPELGLEPHEVAHIGDNPEADVEGARAVGMRAVHYVVGGRPVAAHADLVVTDLASLGEHLAAG
ncbi:MAG TPA: HAD family hydrolase [Methylomirabilota bacterium]|nr:HAD family hydrolase [Methylomirabilota bacterium]